MKQTPLSLLLLLGCLVILACNTTNSKEQESASSSTQTPAEQDKVQPPPTKPVDALLNERMKSKPEDKGSITGIDISRFQGDEVSWLSEKKDSIHFVICKATEGNTYVDPKFAYNWKNIPERGFIRGAYHFYRTNDKPETQSANFVNAIKDITRADFPPIVDFEEGSIKGTQSTSQIQEDLLAFLKEVESGTGRKVMIYTDINTGNKYLDNPRFSEYALWIANYIKGDEPDLPKAWKDTGWYVWQHNDRGMINHTANDCDLFNGDLAALKNFIATY